MTNLVEEMSNDFDHSYSPEKYADIVLKYHKKGADNQQLLMAMTSTLNDLTYGLDSPSDIFRTVPKKITVLLELINNLWKFGKLPEITRSQIE